MEFRRNHKNVPTKTLRKTIPEMAGNLLNFSQNAERLRQFKKRKQAKKKKQKIFQSLQRKKKSKLNKEVVRNTFFSCPFRIVFVLISGTIFRFFLFIFRRVNPSPSMTI